MAAASGGKSAWVYSERNDGYRTVVGERGSDLIGRSCGKRLAIARAVLKNAPILLLDEAQLASRSENEMLATRARLPDVQSTTIVDCSYPACHRAQGGSILVLEGGRVIGGGNMTAALIRKRRRYSSFAELQFPISLRGRRPMERRCGVRGKRQTVADRAKRAPSAFALGKEA